ncbi:hypothetical protein GH714_038373 [Hevea brasiliensis]|uniref:Uncharacterized protein n=1 Tax=Hevea brasiliensis TaxID=3981 RepID=A0A6A6MTD4_HEVBR|nr:hypothetical protein GH714_038373 [Hevea brasiliensis]
MGRRFNPGVFKLCSGLKVSRLHDDPSRRQNNRRLLLRRLGYYLRPAVASRRFPLPFGYLDGCSVSYSVGTKKTLWFVPLLSKDRLDIIIALNGLDFSTVSDAEAWDLDI